MVLRLLVVVLLGVVLARPRTSRPDDEIDVEGIDIVVTLDLSGSMAETDLLPNRLDAAKVVIRDFVRRRPTDRIGLVVFARDAYTYVPLTLDHGTLLRMLGELQLDLIDGKGTAIGNGLGVALTRLRRSDAQVEGDHPADRRGQQRRQHHARCRPPGIAQQLGVKIYTVLAGDNDSRTPASRARAPALPGQPQAAGGDRHQTGGTPYLATDTQALAERFQDILDDLEKSRIRERGVLYAELFPRFLLPALLVLLLEIALAPHPLAPVALTMRFAQPHAAVVAAAGAAGGAGAGGRVHAPAAAAGTAGRPGAGRAHGGRVSVPRKVLRAILLVLALALLLLALARPQRADGPSWNGSAAWTWWWRSTSPSRCWPATCTPRASSAPSASWSG